MGGLNSRDGGLPKQWKGQAARQLRQAEAKKWGDAKRVVDLMRLLKACVLQYAPDHADGEALSFLVEDLSKMDVDDLAVQVIGQGKPGAYVLLRLLSPEDLAEAAKSKATPPEAG